MSKKNCIVCGLPEKACLHTLKELDENINYRVSKILWFTLGFISALSFYFISCQVHYVTNYRIKEGKRTYYTNEYEIKNDTVFFNETGRNNLPVRYFGIAYNEVEIIEN